MPPLPPPPPPPRCGDSHLRDRLRPAPPQVHYRDSPSPPRDRYNSTQKKFQQYRVPDLTYLASCRHDMQASSLSEGSGPRPCVVIPRKLTVFIQGLARMSHRNKLTFGTFRHYEYEPVGGEGVIIDTGINIAHVEFQGRASGGKTIPANDVDEDGNGHGSHCAGSIASAKYGVAKAANVVAVKGNDNRDACSYSPAAAEKAVTVGASTLGDEHTYFSNCGPCVDVFAPGLNILSTYTGSPTAVATLSSASMASPHTAGMLAYLLSLYPSKTFNPEIEEMPLFAMMQLQRPFASALSSPTYMFAHAALPRWAASFLPAPRVSEGILKKALLDLASTGKPTDLPDKMVNLLIFNKATTA
ncbi:peptidase S8/S53 domain-containing protein [Mycena galericulata]|nr:peptidase S8/S53 domain-containing protein [Mycena galericulata]